MTKYICEIRASTLFYYKEIFYDAGSHARKIVSGILSRNTCATWARRIILSRRIYLIFWLLQWCFLDIGYYIKIQRIYVTS